MKHKPWHVVTRGRRSGVGLRFVFIFITAFASPSTLLASVNGHGGSPERPSYLLTVIQSFRGGTSPSGTCLSILSLFLPQASTLRPQILSSCGCLDIGAPSRSPSCPPAAFGTRSQAPGRGAPELAEAGIRLGRGGRDWRRPGLRGGLRSVWGRGYGADRPSIGGGRGRRRVLWTRAGRGGQRDEELGEAGREMSDAAASRERDSAGWRAVGSWAGTLGRGRRRAKLSGGQGLRFGPWTHGAKAEVLRRCGSCG